MPLFRMLSIDLEAGRIRAVAIAYVPVQMCINGGKGCKAKGCHEQGDVRVRGERSARTVQMHPVLQARESGVQGGCDQR